MLIKTSFHKKSNFWNIMIIKQFLFDKQISVTIIR